MTRFLGMTLFAVMTTGVLAGSAEAQPGRHGNSSHWNPPGYGVPVQPMPSRVHGHGRLPGHFNRGIWQRFPGASTLGFVGDFTRRGLIVRQVLPGSEACRIGLRPGDMILQANRVEILCERDWLLALQHAGRDMRMLVRRPCGRVDRLRARLDCRAALEAPHLHHGSGFGFQTVGLEPLPPVPQFQGLFPHQVQQPGGYHLTLGNNNVQIGFRLGN